jgi:hypothetical protein
LELNFYDVKNVLKMFLELLIILKEQGFV